MQGRFKGESVNSDEYPLTVIRYIHQNLKKAGIANTSWVLDLFDGALGFRRFHEAQDHSARCIDEDRGRQILDSDSALRAARSAVEPFRIEEEPRLPRRQRGRLLCKLKRSGLSVRQIERLTGISKSVVAKAREGQ